MAVDNACSSEAPVLSRDREGAVVKSKVLRFAHEQLPMQFDFLYKALRPERSGRVYR